MRVAVSERREQGQQAKRQERRCLAAYSQSCAYGLRMCFVCVKRARESERTIGNILFFFICRASFISIVVVVAFIIYLIALT
jgi:hypothetical protein